MCSPSRRSAGAGPAPDRCPPSRPTTPGRPPARGMTAPTPASRLGSTATRSGDRGLPTATERGERGPMLADHTTLAQFLIEERRRHPGARGDLDSLILDVALACKAIAHRVALGALRDAVGKLDRTNVQGEVQHKLDVIANEYFLRTTERGGRVAGMVSEELDEPYVLPAECMRGK